MTPPLFLLLDGQNMAHRDYHAAGLDRIGRIVESRIEAMKCLWQPERIVAAFDPTGPTFRHSLFDGYKAGREHDPAIAEAIEATQDALLSWGVPCVIVDEFEADDVLATFASKLVASGGRVVIYSADKDLHQLVTAGAITQATSVKRSGNRLACEWINAETLGSRYGVTPSQWVDYRVMVGDKSDGIKGIDGVGDVAARAVLQSYADLDAFYRDPFKAAVSPSQRTKLFNGRGRVAGLRELLTLRRDVPLGISWGDL